MEQSMTLHCGSSAVPLVPTDASVACSSFVRYRRLRDPVKFLRPILTESASNRDVKRSKVSREDLVQEKHEPLSITKIDFAA
jgi:hypothetical protein